MEKGDTVLVQAKVVARYDTDRAGFGLTKIHEPKGRDSVNKKCLFRYAFLLRPVKGIVVGWSCRATGLYSSPGYQDSDGSATLDVDKRHRVWMVQPFNEDQRWNKPMACLEEDLEIVEGEARNGN